MRLFDSVRNTYTIASLLLTSVAAPLTGCVAHQESYLVDSQKQCEPLFQKQEKADHFYFSGTRDCQAQEGSDLVEKCQSRVQWKYDLMILEAEAAFDRCERSIGSQL